MYLTASGAKTTNKNTPETDLLPEVMHTVTYYIDNKEGKSGILQIMAKDPQDAIKKINRMTIHDIKP